MNAQPFPHRQATVRQRPMHDIAADSMHMWFDHIRKKGETDALSPEQFYGFRAEDVAEIHFRKHGIGRGFWYRLNDGRVFDGHGNPSEPDRSCYEPG